MNSTEYWTEINSIAASIATECMDECDNDRDKAEELINDSRLHEEIDSHQWVIYYSYNLDVIQHSDNSDYMTDKFGNDYAGQILADKGLNDLHTAIAFWCMHADVQDKLSDALDTIEESLPETD